MGSAILGLGRHLPPLVERAGVLRPIAIEPGGPSMLAAPAARAALRQAHLTEADVDFLIFATMTPDVTFPGAGCFLQRELDLGTIGALDVRGQCAGFLYALAIADDFIKTESYRTILVVGGELHSSALDYSERGQAVARCFADGAGAAILGAATNTSGIRAVVVHCDGRQHDRFWCEYPASRQHPTRFTLENFNAGGHFPKIDFDAVSRFGREQLPAGIQEALAAASVDVSAVDCFIVSHLLPEVAAVAARSAGIESSRLRIPSADHGHLTAAALPISLSEAVDAGTLGPGSIVCLAAAGAGFCWGAAVVEL